MSVWDEQDLGNGLPGLMARIVASKISGLPPSEVEPEPDDFAVADALAVDLSRYVGDES